MKTFKCSFPIDFTFNMSILRYDTRHKSLLFHVNVFLRHYGGQLKAAVEQELGEKIDCKRLHQSEKEIRI